LKIEVKGARENNLKDVDLVLGDGLTVVTGVSGSGKTSLVFDTVYHEARRRFQEVFAFGSQGSRLTPARVDSIRGLGPAVAVGQNLLNRNPGSTVATASGLHPFLRILYARFGIRACRFCGASLTILSEDEIVDRITSMFAVGSVSVYAPIVNGLRGTHDALLRLLVEELGSERVLVDNEKWDGRSLNPKKDHKISILMGAFSDSSSTGDIREAVNGAFLLGATSIIAENSETRVNLSHSQVCPSCGLWFRDIEASHFNRVCPSCNGKGCRECSDTGLWPEVSSITWRGFRISELLSNNVEYVYKLFQETIMPRTADRILVEINKRLDALRVVGLGYVDLDRSSPSLSRGEAQRVRLAVTLTSRLEDVLHILDEPTIGQHPYDVKRLLPAFRKLAGPVIYVEHDRVAAAMADHSVDMGPGAGSMGGEIVFMGTPSELWNQDTHTGRYFSLHERVKTPEKRELPRRFIELKEANMHNLRDIDVKIPLGRLSVISGVSGSGKSTLVKDVLVASLKEGEPVGCKEIIGGSQKVVLVDQSPIGKNPRSTPSTYTKLSDWIRDLFADETGYSASHFSFNRPEGACPTCNGMGAVEVKMRFLPSTWIPCADCEGRRFNDKVLEAHVSFGEEHLNIADFNALSITEAYDILSKKLVSKETRSAKHIMKALIDIGLGYLPLGQPSPSLSGGEAQRVKLAKYLGRKSLSGRVIVLDEPSTGLHPYDLAGLLTVLDRLVKSGATIVVVEHNTDIIRAADWVIDLGPKAGPNGGEVVYMGDVKGLLDCEASLTAEALKSEEELVPSIGTAKPFKQSHYIKIRGARANNLKDVNVDIPKGRLTVVTGVSGSGKSSLVGDVLEVEARRRFLETLTLYERQGIREGPEAPVDSITGLGVTLTVTPDRKLYERRSTVGTATEIWHHLAVLFSSIGKRTCLKCGTEMERKQSWVCSQCGDTAPIAPPRRFNPTTYGSACKTCHGVGTLQKPRPDKLIRNPEKPLCRGAMYSPGFFPQGFLCKPGNSGYDIVQALGKKHGFTPSTTPWIEMSEKVRDIFLYGDPEPLEVTFINPKGKSRKRSYKFDGFYGWIRDWDVGGTYTDTVTCPECQGKRFRLEYLAVKIADQNIHDINEKPLKQLIPIFEKLDIPETSQTIHSLRTIEKRLKFLNQMGLSYLNLNRVSGSLSAGEAQRVKLAGLLGSELTGLTVLLDEPSRGLHPREVNTLLGALKELRDEGNTVIIVEHDPEIIKQADHIIDMGPGAGNSGGKKVAEGSPDEVALSNTITGQWLMGKKKPLLPSNRLKPTKWFTIEGAREHNLRVDSLNIPLGVLVGVCGVSGSGKSTLIIDTLGRALAPAKHTTSVAKEPLDPGEYDSIIGAPKRTIIVDQTKNKIGNPASYLSINKELIKIYSQSEDAIALGLDEKKLGKRCSACQGKGQIALDMGFLPSVYVECETCQGTGYTPEAWDVQLNGYSLPELNRLTISEVYYLFKEEPRISRPLSEAINVGLGYLVLKQPGITLSGGEAQRLKIALELSKKNKEGLFILDEPTLGQHQEDVERLIRVLHRLVNAGNSVIVIEHNPNILASCDYIIELGPEGGPEGGRIIATGTPEVVSEEDTPTAPYLKVLLEDAQ